MTMENSSAVSSCSISPDVVAKAESPPATSPNAATTVMSPGPTNATPTVLCQGLTMEPPKKRAAFSISSILGEDDALKKKKRPEEGNTSPRHQRHGVDDDGADVALSRNTSTPSPGKGEHRFETEASEGLLGSPVIAGLRAQSSSPSSPPLEGPDRSPSRLFPTSQLPAPHPPAGSTSPLSSSQDAAKYKALLAAHLANPDMAASLYRLPLFWNPWMVAATMQGAAAAGFPPAAAAALHRNAPFFSAAQLPVSAAQDGLISRKSFDEAKELLEAGEILRPVSCRRPPPLGLTPHTAHTYFPVSDPRQHPSLGRHSENSHSGNANSRSPSSSPVTSQSQFPVFMTSQLEALHHQQRLPLHGLAMSRLHPDVIKHQQNNNSERGEEDRIRERGEEVRIRESSNSFKSGRLVDCDLDKDNEMVEIDIDEDLSDTEADDSGHLRDDGDGLNKSNSERKKKTRTVFSRCQIGQLETMFDLKRYLSSSERSGLAKALNMTETQVKIWFQNRRNKWKRQIAAEMEAANMSQVTGSRLMQLPYMYAPEELGHRGMRSNNLPSLPTMPPSSHPVLPPSMHHYYNNMLRAHSS